MRPRILVTATATALAIATGGCGDEKTPVACYALDATNPAIEVEYVDAFHTALEESSRAEMDVRVVLFRGDALSGSRPITESFKDLGAAERDADRRQRLNRVEGKVEDQLEDMRAGIATTADRSAIVDAIKVVATRRQVCDTLDVYSDGLERVRFSVYDDAIDTPSGRTAIVERLKSDKALPDLAELTVRMPFGGFVFGTSRLAEPRKQALELLWDDIITAFGGRLEWGA